MQRQYFFITAVLAVISISLFSAEGTAIAYKSKGSQKALADDAMSSMDDCSQLTTEEQNFAAKLSDMNAMNFCSKMTAAQRKKAMQMVNGKAASGTKMSPNDAVQKVMQENNSKQQRPAGSACPVK